MAKLIGLSLIVFFCACSFSSNRELNSLSNRSNIALTDSVDQEIKLIVHLNSFDTAIEVLFVDTKDTLSDIQLQNLKLFISKQDLLSQEILLRIFEYYEASYLDYKNGWTMVDEMREEELEKYLPIPTTPEKLKAFIKPAALYIQSKEDCKEGVIGIEFDCTWDIENGLGVLIENWKVANVGTAHISYF